MWSSVWTLWPIPFARALDVTVLLDNWKMPSALWFFDVPSSCSSGDLVSHIPRWKCRDRRTGWQCQGGSVLSVSGAGTVPMRRVLWYILPCFMPSAQVPVAFHILCLFPAGALHVPAGAPWTWGGRGMCSLTHPVCILQQSPLSFSSGNLYTQRDKSCLSDPISVGISCPQTEVVCLISCLHSRQWLCARLLPQTCTLTFLYPWVIVHLAGKDTCMGNTLLIFIQTLLRFPPNEYSENWRD